MSLSEMKLLLVAIILSLLLYMLGVSIVFFYIFKLEVSSFYRAAFSCLLRNLEQHRTRQHATFMSRSFPSECRSSYTHDADSQEQVHRSANFSKRNANIFLFHAFSFFKYNPKIKLRQTWIARFTNDSCVRVV